MKTKAFWQAVGRVSKREWGRIRQRKTQYVLILFIPILVFLTIAAVYQPGVIKELPIAVVDQDHSELSRTVIRFLDVTRTLQVRYVFTDTEQIEDAFKSGKIQAAVVIPANLEKQLKRGKNGQVVLYQNATNIIIGNVILKAAAGAIRTLSVGIDVKHYQARGATNDQQALDRALPIGVEVHSLFNPQYNYENFLVAGLLPILYQMVVMISAVLLFSSELEERTLTELYQTANHRLSAVVLGKSLPHLLLHAANILLLVGIVFPLFRIPVHSSLLIIFAYLLFFVLVVFVFGLVLSCLFTNMTLAVEAAIFVSTPAFIFTGFTFPLQAMPAFHQWYAHLLPSTPFLRGFVKLYQMGTPLSTLLPELKFLALFLVAGMFALHVLLRFRCKLSGGAS